MAQGVIKSRVSKTTSGHKSTGVAPKKGARVIAPKKRVLMQQQKIKKKFSAGLTAMTEQTLGTKVGHLELLGNGGKKRSSTTSTTQGKSNKKQDESEKKKTKNVGGTERLKGGSKKFG